MPDKNLIIKALLARGEQIEPHAMHGKRVRITKTAFVMRTRDGTLRPHPPCGYYFVGEDGSVKLGGNLNQTTYLQPHLVKYLEDEGRALG